MALEQDRPRLGLLPEQVGDAPGHVEAGPLVVEPDRLVAERLLGQAAPARRGREGDDRVGMRVVDVVGRDERVQEGLDRRPWLVGADGAAQEIVDHLRIGHRVTVAERKHLVEAQPGESGRA